MSNHQSYKRAHTADMRRTAKDEKRRILLNAVMTFVYSLDINTSSRLYYKLWGNLVAKIDKLKLFE